MPSDSPSDSPSSLPSETPSAEPTGIQSLSPSFIPSNISSQLPSTIPSLSPLIFPLANPSTIPSRTPSTAPSLSPSIAPSNIPSSRPSANPSQVPSRRPSTYYIGCYDDTRAINQDFTLYHSTSAAVSAVQCRLDCEELGFEYAALEQIDRQGNTYNSCFCGNDYGVPCRDEVQCRLLRSMWREYGQKCVLDGVTSGTSYRFDVFNRCGLYHYDDSTNHVLTVQVALPCRPKHALPPACIEGT